LAGDAAHQMPPFAGQGMCSGVRDAANLAWRLSFVVRRRADESLLDGCQAEREPHVRAIVEQAISMGRVVCTLDPEVAAARDKTMLADRAAGRSAGPPPPAPTDGCFLQGSAGAGEIFPQPWTQAADGSTLRLDDVLGDGAWLIYDDRGGQIADADGVTSFHLSAPIMAPFAQQLRAWLAAHCETAVFVRPDRYVFGTGDPRTLLRAFHQQLRAGPGDRGSFPEAAEVAVSGVAEIRSPS
jgi:3-(3-hydroxy-phenyl)propionate hydroxylase